MNDKIERKRQPEYRDPNEAHLEAFLNVQRDMRRRAEAMGDAGAIGEDKVRGGEGTAKRMDEAAATYDEQQDQS